MVLKQDVLDASFHQIRTELEEKLKFDETTYLHSRNVAQYGVKLLRTLECDIDEELMYYAGLFHDIGKIKIDPAILNKDGILSKNEFDEIKKHVYHGYSILLKRGALAGMQLAAQLHHERFDGTGYPLGLKGEMIPLIVRIISIADVFSALTSDRPYRKAYSFEEAFKIMSSSQGQFDPELLKKFFLCL